MVSNNTDLKEPLAQGKAVVRNNTWYHLELDVAPAGTRALLDGQQVAMVTQLTSGNLHGWIGLGSSYDFVQFDRLAINRSTQMAPFPHFALAAAE